MYKKKGFPKRNELVLCTVKSLDTHSAMMELDEYNNVEGMLHSTELHRRWLRKWKSMLKPGTKTVCMVMDADERSGHVNLSIKRVGEGQQINKLAEVKRERAADGILTFFGKENDIKDVYVEIGNKILEEYGRLYPFFVDIASEGSKLLTEIGIEKGLAEKLANFIANRITVPKASVTGEIRITSLEPNGIVLIKSALNNAIDFAKKQGAELELIYLGAPRFKFTLTAENPKIRDRTLKEIEELLKDSINNGEVKISVQ